MNKFNELRLELIEQYNHQNGGGDPEPTEEYVYKLKEWQLDLIISALRKAKDSEIFNEYVKKQEGE